MSLAEQDEVPETPVRYTTAVMVPLENTSEQPFPSDIVAVIVTEVVAFSVSVIAPALFSTTLVTEGVAFVTVTDVEAVSAKTSGVIT